jgi:thiol:disulfide interchange protein
MSNEPRKDILREPSEQSRIHTQVEQAEQEIYNAAQQARGAQGHEQKKLRDSANVSETWDNPAGHSGRPIGYAASGVIVLGFILGGIGLTVGPHVLIWIGVAIIVIVGAVGMAAHVWSDYRSGSAEGSGPA